MSTLLITLDGVLKLYIMLGQNELKRNSPGKVSSKPRFYSNQSKVPEMNPSGQE
jgi:hypothetical protein